MKLLFCFTLCLLISTSALAQQKKTLSNEDLVEPEPEVNNQPTTTNQPFKYVTMKYIKVAAEGCQMVDVGEFIGKRTYTIVLWKGYFKELSDPIRYFVIVNLGLGVRLNFEKENLIKLSKELFRL